MRDKWCADYLDEKVVKILRESGYGYLKVDYNENIGVGCDGAESLGEGLRQYALASQEYFKHIHEKLPELVIENCASGGHRLEPSTMELCSMASFSDAHECKSIPIIAANVQRMIRPSQSQIWAVLRKGDDIHRVNYSLTAGFLGRLCLSGEIFDIPVENWQVTLKAVEFYSEIAPIIKDGFTSVIDCTAEDYSSPEGWQIVLREMGNMALLIVHTFKGGASPPYEKYLEVWQTDKTFGSELDGEFRGKAFLLKR
jgi:alpha-galactosidase